MRIAWAAVGLIGGAIFACSSVELGTRSGVIANPSFEAGLQGWSVGPIPAAVELADEADEGARSLRFVDKAAFASQTVPVRPQTIYRLRALVRGQGTIGARVGPEIFFEQSANPNWKAVVVTFATSTATTVSLFGSAAQGGMGLDGFGLYEVLVGQADLSPRVRRSRAGGHGLSPDLPPGRNFELIDWYLNTPADDDRNGKSDRISEARLAAGYADARYFETASDGGMVFRATVNGARTSKNTKYTRTELREMLRGGDRSIRTRTDDGRPNRNNWVFSSAPLAAQRAAGGVDGILRATLTVDHVTTTGDREQVGRVIIGQIHAKDDEPARLYYRKLPSHSRGSLYVAHEPSGGDDVFYELIGRRASSGLDPTDGIALGEKFTYEIEAKANRLWVRIWQAGQMRAEAAIDMTSSGYDVEDDYMYFKAGVYNQNNSGEADDYVQATFYELENRHRPAPQ